ncbi:hypothetical protein [Streptomyces sp. cg36]|uniref:hypothetical protein n=1 Tax=Streptomyces sp. cg36 TaxID=3238798 RepID=UPI0034E2807D
MLLMIAKSAEVSQHPTNALKVLTERLSGQYHAVVNPLLLRQAELFGIPESRLTSSTRDKFRQAAYMPDDNVIAAEMYAKGSILIAIRLIEATSSRPRRGADGKMARQEVTYRAISVAYAGPAIDDRVISEFESHVKDLWDADLVEIKAASRKLEEIEQVSQGGRAECPTEQDILCANILSDRSTRVLAVAIKSSSGLLLSDAPKQIPQKERGRLDEVVKSLADAGVVAAEIVVICSKTSAQVNRVPSIEVLASLDEHGIRCSCGRKLSEERTEEALSVTDYGRVMLDGSRWLSVLVLHHLMDLGVPIGSIRMEQEYAGEEIDCIADVYGRLVLFELKDKQFNLGNAYSFGAKVGIFRPDYPVIITTEKVGSDAREHFARSMQRGRRSPRYLSGDGDAAESMQFIEGITNLRPGLEDLLTSLAIEAFAPITQSALNFATGSPAAILAAWSGRNL